MTVYTHRIATCLFLVLLLPMPLAAQDRLPPIPPEKMTDEQKAAAAQLAKSRGREVFGPFVPLLRSPEVMLRAEAMGEYLRYRSAFPPRLSEFVILTTARHWTQQYEWNVHYPEALKAGLNPDIAKAIAEGRRPTGMSEDEEILYQFSIELQQNRSVSDPTYARVVSRFGERGVIDLVGIIGYYTFQSLVLNTARTPVPENGVPKLTPFP
jgi:4-carboxymuconolactone decarboxylase